MEWRGTELKTHRLMSVGLLPLIDGRAEFAERSRVEGGIEGP